MNLEGLWICTNAENVYRIQFYTDSFVLYTEAKEVSYVDFQECHVRRKGTWYYHGSSIFLHYTDGCTSWNTGSTDTLTVDSIIGNRVYLKGQYCRIFKSNNE